MASMPLEEKKGKRSSRRLLARSEQLLKIAFQRLAPLSVDHREGDTHQGHIGGKLLYLVGTLAKVVVKPAGPPQPPRTATFQAKALQPYLRHQSTRQDPENRCP